MIVQNWAFFWKRRVMAKRQVSLGMGASPLSQLANCLDPFCLPHNLSSMLGMDLEKGRQTSSDVQRPRQTTPQMDGARFQVAMANSTRRDGQFPRLQVAPYRRSNEEKRRRCGSTTKQALNA